MRLVRITDDDMDHAAQLLAPYRDADGRLADKRICEHPGLDQALRSGVRFFWYAYCRKKAELELEPAAVWLMQNMRYVLPAQ